MSVDETGHNSLPAEVNNFRPLWSAGLPGGYALTYGVRKDLWDQWYEQNKTSKLVKQRVVFASPSLQAATAEARENRSVKSGMEPVDPDNPAQRMPGGMDHRLRMSILNADEPGTSQR